MAVPPEMQETLAAKVATETPLGGTPADLVAGFTTVKPPQNPVAIPAAVRGAADLIILTAAAVAAALEL